MKLQEKIKKYFTEKPKSGFWFWAFLTLLLFRYVAPVSLMLLIPFQIGLISPETSVNYYSIADKITNSLILPLKTFNETGAQIANENPIIALIMFYILSYFVFIIWFAVIVLIFNLLRFLIYYLFFYKRYPDISKKIKVRVKK